jgi:serine O-acetyltransferase
MEELNKNDLAEYVNTQLGHFFPDKNNALPLILKNIDEAMDRMLYSLKHVKLTGYTKFSHLHSDLYAQFIYYLSNTVWGNDADKNVAGKLFYLNKALHAINCMYDTVLPDIFLLIHCVGTILGKASYNNYFVACHNVTVGTDKGFSPIISEKVYMGPGSSIVGKSVVGSNCLLTINTIVLNQDTNNDSVVIGNSPNLTFNSLKRNIINEQYFI